MTSSLKDRFEIHKKYAAYFTGHHIEITNDGKTILAECENSVEVINIENAEASENISVDEDTIINISLSPNNESLILALRSSSLNHYEWPSKKLIRGFKSYHQASVSALCWDSSSTLLASGSADGAVRVWDLKQNFCTHSLKNNQGIVGQLLFSKNLGKKPWIYIACGNDICVWSLKVGSAKLLGTLQCHTAAVSGIAVTSDEKHLVSSGLDRVLVLWDLEERKTIRLIPVYESLSGLLLQPYGIQFVGICQSSETDINVMVIGDKGTPSIWQVNSGIELWRAKEPTISTTEQEGSSLCKQMIMCHPLKSVVFTSFENLIIFASYDSMKTSKLLTGHNGEILDLVFVGENNSYLVVASNSPQMRIYNCENMNCNLVKGHTAIVLALARHNENPDIFASSSHDFTTRVWKLNGDYGASCFAIAQGHTQSIGAVSFGHNFLLTGSKDTCLKMWDFDQNNLLNQKTPISLTCTATQKGHEKDINCMCVSKNSKLIASGSQDKTAKIWSANSLSLLGTLEGHKRGLWCVEFSPADQVLATASADCSIRLWTLNNFATAVVLEGHDASVQKVAWISHGLQLVSVAADGLLKLWTVKGGICVNTIGGHNGRVWGLSVAENKNLIITGGEDSSMILWRDVTQEYREKNLEEAHKLAEQEQTLSNLIHKKEWREALSFAIRLNKPMHGLKLMKELLDESPEDLPEVLKMLKPHETGTLLQFATHWNSKTKHMREAQMIIYNLMKIYEPKAIEELPQWQKTLEGLLPYTEKHLRRLSALHQSCSIIKFMMASMGSGLGERAQDFNSVKAPTEHDLLLTIQMPKIAPSVTEPTVLKDTSTVEQSADLDNCDYMDINACYTQNDEEKSEEDEPNLIDEAHSDEEDGSELEIEANS